MTLQELRMRMRELKADPNPTAEILQEIHRVRRELAHLIIESVKAKRAEQGINAVVDNIPAMTEAMKYKAMDAFNAIKDMQYGIGFVENNVAVVIAKLDKDFAEGVIDRKTYERRARHLLQERRSEET